VGGEDFDVDIHSVAQLIKVWFRELPSSVLTTIPVETMMGCDDEVAVLAAFKQMPEPQASLLVYLLDLLANVAMGAGINRMTAKNLAIVYGPNLLVSSVSPTPHVFPACCPHIPRMLHTYAHTPRPTLLPLCCASLMFLLARFQPHRLVFVTGRRNAITDADTGDDAEVCVLHAAPH
jgi:hypothetical protein